MTRSLYVILTVLAVLPLSDFILPESLHFVTLMPPILIFMLVSLGLTVVTGFTGLLHLGVAAFIAIGAYTFSILTSPIYPFQIGFGFGLIASTIAGGLTGVLLGIPTLGLRGDYLAIVTLGFGEIVQDVLRNFLDSITKGTQGINPLPNPKIFSIEITTSLYLGWYYLVFVILLAAIWVVLRLQRSHIGRAWMAIHDDELAATCTGINAVSAKLTAFALGAALCALAGASYAAYLGSSGEPGNYDFQLSIMALSMVIVGGLGSISGALIGALVIVGINSILLVKAAEFISRIANDSSSNVFLSPSNWKYLIFGLAMVLMMRFKSDGILPVKK